MRKRNQSFGPTSPGLGLEPSETLTNNRHSAWIIFKLGLASSLLVSRRKPTGNLNIALNKKRSNCNQLDLACEIFKGMLNCPGETHMHDKNENY